MESVKGARGKDVLVVTDEGGKEAKYAMDRVKSFIRTPKTSWEDLEEKRVPAMMGSGEGIVAIHSSKERPKRPYATVRYRDLWFYIDDQDVRSKRMFTFLMFLFSLTETGSGAPSPVITVPT